MNMRVLITGGAGFIGTALAHALIGSQTCQVVALDSLVPQVHDDGNLLARFPRAALLVKGDVRNAELLDLVLRAIGLGHRVEVSFGAGRVRGLPVRKDLVDGRLQACYLRLCF